MLVGDFNARIGDFRINKQIANPALTEMRKSRDTVVNKQGDKLISLIFERDGEIINGTTNGDPEGHFTFSNKNGQSTIDFCFTTGSFTELILDLEVGKAMWSDHLPLEIKVNLVKPKENNNKLLPVKLTLKGSGKNTFRNTFIKKLSSSNRNTSRSVEDRVQHLQRIITDSVPKRRYVKHKKVSEWFNQNCQTMKKIAEKT